MHEILFSIAAIGGCVLAAAALAGSAMWLVVRAIRKSA